MILQFVLVDVHQSDAIDLALSSIGEERVKRTIGDLKFLHLFVYVEEIVLQILLSLVSLCLALFDNLHRIGTTSLKDIHPELQLVLQLLTTVGISCIRQENVLHSLAAWIHVLNALDKALYHLESAKLIQSVKTLLKQTRRIFYFFTKL